MKQITIKAFITSIRSRKDDSLGLSLETAKEMSPEEMVEVFKLHKQQVQAVFIPLDEPNAPALVIDKDLEQKSQSQRLRGVLYVYWQQHGEQGDFADFYRKEMEKLIEVYKRRLDD